MELLKELCECSGIPGREERLSEMKVRLSLGMKDS